MKSKHLLLTILKNQQILWYYLDKAFFLKINAEQIKRADNETK